MGKKRQKVRWLCIEDSGRSQGVVEGEEEEVSSAARMSLSPEQTIPIPHPHPPHRIYHLDKSSNLNNGTNNPSSSTYARRPVAPRFERKAAAAEVLYDSRQFRGRELSGESGEELPLGFTKIRSKNLDVLFKRDYYSTKGMNSEANTHSETSSLTQKEDEKEEDVEEEEEEEEEEELEEEYEEDISSNNKKESTPKLTSKLNGSSSPFYPSSPGYVMSMHHPYMTGRPNLFLYSPSSNTMIPCEEVVVPGMFSGSPSSPQNVYLAAFPMEGSNPYMMHPSYAAPPPPYYPPQPVYSDAEPSSAESTVPHSPPDLSAYNPAYWGEVHSHRGYYPHPSYQYQADQVYSQTSLEASPQQTPEEVPEIEHSLPDKKEETDYNNDNRRVPGLPPQPKKSQKKKRKKKSKQPSELVHRNSTSSEDGQTIHHIKDEVPSNIEQTKSDEVSTEESMNEFKPSASSSPSVVIEEEEVAKSEEENQILEDVSKSAPQVVVEPSPSSSSPDDNEDIIELVAKSQVIETPVPIIEESTTEPHCSPEPEVVPPPEEEEEEKISQVVLDEKVEEVKKLPMEDVEEKVDIVADKTPRMLYSSVVSQSMPQPPPKSPVHNKTPKKSLTEASPPLPKVELPISTSMENLRPTEKVEKEESEWLESSSRKKVKRHRQSKKSKSSKYSSSLSSSMIRSVSLDTSSKKEVSIVQHQKKETEIEDLPATTCSLDVLPSCFKSEESSDVATTTTTTPTPTPPQESETEKQLVDPSPQREEKSNELAEEKMPSNSLVSKKSVVKKKKKRGNNGGGGGIASDSSSKSLNSGESSAKKQVLICDGDIDVSSSFSSFKKVSDFGNLRIHSQPFSKVSLDTVFISDVGIGIRNGPIMSGRPLRVGKYSPPDRAKEILSMKASLSTEDSTTTTTTTKENNAQYTVPLD